MGLKDIAQNLLNKGEHKKEQVKTAELSSMEAEFAEITARLQEERRTREGFGRFMKHPLEVLTEKPENILIVCIPLGLLFFVLGSVYMIGTYGLQVLFKTTSIDDFAVFAVLICIVPLAILDLREQWRVSNLENALPNFFRDLAGMNDSGMTLPNAVHLVATAEYGTLTPHIHKLDNEMSWGVGFVEALYRFGKGLGTNLSDRSVDLIAKASRAGGDVSEVLRAAAKDTFEIVNLKQERTNNMIIYVIIVLVSFAVFCFVIAILVSSFLTTMATAGATASASGARGFGGIIDLFLYKRLFAHAAMLQGFFSGLVAGQMGEGRVLAGLKYSAIMLIIAWVVFRFFI
ncbi:MAG: type II secretion system F family protein [Methanoregulaceae archaeon]|nr:MAG: type II secretion system F family protein [Methanoregulaceae archaeon]